MTMAISWYHDIIYNYIYIHIVYLILFNYEYMFLNSMTTKIHQTSLQWPASLVGVSAVAMAITEGHRLWVQWRPSSYRPVGDPETELSWVGDPYEIPSRHHLVGGWALPLWKIMEWKSVGMMTFLRYGKMKFMLQTTNQMLLHHL
jgi:hypothetical protein